MVDILNNAQPTDSTTTGSPSMPPEPPPQPLEVATIDQPPSPPPDPLIAQPNQDIKPIVSPSETQVTPSPLSNPTFRKKKSPKGFLLAVVLLLLITLPLAVFYVSQQNQSNDLRSRAAVYLGESECENCILSHTNNVNYCTTVCGTSPTVPPNCPTGSSYTCCIHDSNACGGHPEQCHCLGGDACTGTTCDSSIGTQCTNQGRSWCTNWQGSGMTCCAVGYKCCSGVLGCCNAGTTSTPTPTQTHHQTNNTPTPTTAPQCPSIQVYKGTQLITDYSTIIPGDSIIIVVGSSATQIRVNGGTFIDLTDKNSDGFWVYNVVVPTSSTSFTIEVQ